MAISFQWGDKKTGVFGHHIQKPWRLSSYEMESANRVQVLFKSAFHLTPMALWKACIQLFSSHQILVNSWGQTLFLSLPKETRHREGKLWIYAAQKNWPCIKSCTWRSGWVYTCWNRIWNNFWNGFSVWLVQFLKKKRDKSKFSWLALLFKSLLKSKFSPIWVSKKRNDKESMICLTPKPSQISFSTVYLNKENE